MRRLIASKIWLFLGKMAWRPWVQRPHCQLDAQSAKCRLAAQNLLAVTEAELQLMYFTVLELCIYVISCGRSDYRKLPAFQSVASPQLPMHTAIKCCSLVDHPLYLLGYHTKSCLIILITNTHLLNIPTSTLPAFHISVYLSCWATPIINRSWFR